MLHVWKGSYTDMQQEAYISWEELSFFINDMIQRNVFLTIPSKPLLTSKEQQLNLFELEPVDLIEKRTTNKPFEMPQYIIDAVLFDGTHDPEDKIKITAYFTHDKSIEENTNFLKKVYRYGSNGFLYDNKQVSYRWDAEGMTISWGTGTREAFHKQVLNWEDVAKYIRNLLDNGSYLQQAEIDKCIAYEYKHAAEIIWYMNQEMNDEYKKTFMKSDDFHFRGVFPSDTESLFSLLQEKEFYNYTVLELKRVSDAYEMDKSIMRLHFTKPTDVYTFVKSLNDTRIQFEAVNFDEVKFEHFITQDTIDEMIAYRIGSERKYMILSYFANHTDKSDRIQYIKKLWGDSGSSEYESNAKGLKLMKGNSFTRPYAVKTLKWKEVEERLTYLIGHDKFLTQTEKDGIFEYEREQLAHEIKNFFYRVPLSYIRPYKLSYDTYEAEELTCFIKNEEMIPHILDLMHNVLVNTDEHSDEYARMNNIYEKVHSYYMGTFTLFNQHKQPVHANIYEPENDVKTSIGKALLVFSKNHDLYEFRDTFESEEDALLEIQSTLNDIDALKDMIKYMNMIEYESRDLDSIITSRIIREELATLYALAKGSKMLDGNEIRYSFNSYISNAHPQYNTGDLVFLSQDQQAIYGTVEDIAEDDITINLYEDAEDIVLSKHDFEESIVHDYKNEYLYDENRPVFKRKSQYDRELSFEELHALGIDNYHYIQLVAPLVLNEKTDSMCFINKENRNRLFIYLEDIYLKVEEIDVNEAFLSRYSFEIDSDNKILDIREIQGVEETNIVKLHNGEVIDHELELQLNERANNYLKALQNKLYYLESLELDFDGQKVEVVYEKNGELKSFTGNEHAFSSFKETYAKNPLINISSLVPLKEDGKGISKPDIRPLTERNYEILNKIAPLIVSGEAGYMRFISNENSHPFVLELFEDKILASHTYEHNGDIVSDPLMEFEVDDRNHRIHARTFEQQPLGIYRDVEIKEGVVLDEELEQGLNEYTNTWFHNILNKEYRLEKLTWYTNNYEVRLVYGNDGNISSFDGDDEDLAYFQEIFAKDPKNRISSLFPYKKADIEKEEPAEKEVAIEKEQHVENKNRSLFTEHILLPEIKEERIDFQINKPMLGAGGAKEKYQANIHAIKLLKELMNEKRLANKEEQETLSKYVGWDSLADVFDETKENWKKEYTELKNLLSETEYRAARESTLTAFYTPPTVISSIYKKLHDMGLTSGNILEPSCGVGNFLGMKPENMDLTFYGVELDFISGNIAKQLYQNATIAVQGFEKMEIPDNLFDAVIGNVPFGEFPIFDPKYKNNTFMIHDYFFAKALDKVKVGGVVIFLTSRFTMDKKNNAVRKYLAQRANLLGAIRLPDSTFLSNAGTRVTSDILILQKREKPFIQMPEWVDVGENEDGLILNSYFIEHPEMVLGDLKEESSAYGKTIVCKEKEETNLSELLDKAMNNIYAEVASTSAFFIDEEDKSIPADTNVRNFSYCISDGKIYYRENSKMYLYETSVTGENRIKGMIQIRDSMRNLIDLQTYGGSDEEIKKQQEKLHLAYDSFVMKYGLLNASANKRAFKEDSSYSLICSLEILNEDHTLKRKADIFYKRTIRPQKQIHYVESVNEALTISMSERGHVDFTYMSELTNLSKIEIIEKLKGIIYPNPMRVDENGDPVYETSDEYLSGNIREKLDYAKNASEQNSDLYTQNVQALKEVLPEPIKAGDISIRLGSTWVPSEVYQQFVYELLKTPRWAQKNIRVLYVVATQEWNITRKRLDESIISTNTYGTHRINAYKIIENTLNLRDVKIFDKVYEDGEEKRVLNKKETAIAQDKQDLIKSKFIEWVWKDPQRREELCNIYNEKFNSIRNRTYDGSSLSFFGMNPDIALRKHQVDAIARVLYGGNTLLAHTVGAGKSFEMIAAGMESKRLRLCHKPLFVVPNNIIGDFASDFYRLYPSANILVATNDTFSKANRQKFFAKITACDYDGIIITHSQSVKLPMSYERQRATIEQQIHDIAICMQLVKENNGEKFTIKQLEQMKKKLQSKLEKLNDSSKKDDMLCFEQLGIDMMFVDEADLFKNLFLYSKMQRVAGISQTDSQRASDLFMKTQYLNEITNNRGVVFATGTPVSNSMAELYTMQRYLQYNMLKKQNLESFDAWASTFGETVTAMELAPEGYTFIGR